jgi:O-antigen/teichoic acid export membrane protein
MGVAAIELLRVPLVGHLLGPEKFGHFVLAYGLATLAATAASAWLTTAIVRFLPEFDTKGAASLGNKLVIRLSRLTVGVVFAVGVVFGWIGYRWLDRPLQILVVPGVMLAVTLSLDRIFLSVLRSRRQTSQYALYSVVQAGTALAIGLVWATMTAGGALELLLPMSLISCLLLPLGWRAWTTTHSEAALNTMPPAAARDWWHYGLPLLGVNVLSWVMSNLDRYALQWMGRVDEVGPYAAVHYISERSIFILTYFISMGVAPIIFAAWERKQKDEVQVFLSQLIIFVLIAGMPICAILAYQPSAFLQILLPKTFASAFPIMPIISGGALLLCIGNVYSEIFTLSKKPHQLLFCYLGAGTTKFIVIIALVPHFGMTACAWGTVVAYGVFMILTMALSHSLLTVKWRWKSFARTILAAVGMLLFAHLSARLLNDSAWRLGLWSGLSLGAYIGILLLLREPSLTSLAGVLRAPLTDQASKQ